MNERFDGYHHWLGIPPEEQPPHHYRLLGVKLFESNADVLGNAADRQMAHVRTFQNGPRAAESQRLLNQLAEARRFLLTPQTKAAYDQVLKSAMPADCFDAQPTKTAPRPAAVSSGAAVASAPRAQPSDASPAVAAAFKPVAAGAQQWGPYQALDRISDTPFGVTYKVRHQQSGRLYSLKTLSTEQVRNTEVVKRFRREIEIVTRLDHPNLIAGVEAGEANGTPWLAMEYVVGADLATLVKHQGPLPVPAAIDYLIQAAQGLSQLHLHGVFHRNLKPHVLLVDLQGRLRIANLLLARVQAGSELANGEDLTQMGEMMGSVEYQPPEQTLNASAVDGRTDIYALGCTLHYLLVGAPPYPGKSMMEKLLGHRKKPIPSLADVRSDVPAELEKIYQKMMAKEPAQRQPSADVLLAELASLGQPAAPRRAANEEQRRHLPWPAIAAGVAIAVALLGLAVWMFR